MDTPQVMLVDDNSLMRKLVASILGRMGIEPIHADNGREALALIHERNLEPALLITDVMMPQLDGVQLAVQVASLRPAVKVLFVSGYAEDGTLGDEYDLPEHRFLAKPFTEEQLTAQVGALLGLDPK